MKKIECVVQQYAWGKTGHNSIVAAIKKASTEQFLIEEDSNYAELWMGTHPSGPAKLHGCDMTLLDWIKCNNISVGATPTGYTQDDLPFLFKVLSVNTALSIQAHPDKTLATELHSRYPSVYKDSNHKPEMAIALTEFECLCGFRTLAEIIDNVLAVPELKVVLGDALDSDQESGDPQTVLKTIFESYMHCSGDITLQQLDILVARLSSQDTCSLSPLESLLLRLHREYPRDSGIFAPCFLNYLRLQKGESFFIGANEPHAYLSGDCIECMALSDNVVRAGLTPKFKDVDTLCRMLHYSSGAPAMLTPLSLDSCTVVYRPPLDKCAEFEVEYINVLAHTTEYAFLTGNYASIFLVMKGQGSVFTLVGDNNEQQENLSLCEGDVVFVAANKQVKVRTGENSAEIYRAHVNLSNK